MQTIQNNPAGDQTGPKIFQPNVIGANQRLVWLSDLGAFVEALPVFPFKQPDESALDAAMRVDREIVKQRPKLKRYLRPRIVGEFEPFEPDAGNGQAVLVQVLSRNVRARQPVKVNVYQRAEG